MNDLSPMLSMTPVFAGFPSPAKDFETGALDLTSFLISKPYATYLARYEGDDMRLFGIYSGDILVVDRSVNISSDFLGVVLIDGKAVLRHVFKDSGDSIFEYGSQQLVKERPRGDGFEAELWGVVTSVIRKF